MQIDKVGLVSHYTELYKKEVAIKTLEGEIYEPPQESIMFLQLLNKL